MFRGGVDTQLNALDAARDLFGAGLCLAQNCSRWSNSTRSRQCLAAVTGIAHRLVWQWHASLKHVFLFEVYRVSILTWNHEMRVEFTTEEFHLAYENSSKFPHESQNQIAGVIL